MTTVFILIWPIRDVDTAFCLCAADLWSADTTQDMNLVRHPAHQPVKQPPTTNLPLLPPYHLPPAPTSGPRLSPSSIDSLIHNAPSYTLPEAGPSILKRPSDADQWPEAASSLSPRRGSIRFSDQDDFSQSHPYMGPMYSGSSSRFPGLNTSPTNHTFAFQAPIHSQPDGTNDLDRPSIIRRRSSQISGAALPTTAQSMAPPTASSISAYPRLGTGYSARPSTAATSVALVPGGSSGAPGTASGRRPSTGFSIVPPNINEIAVVKNLVGALVVNGHLLRVPGESGAGIFFVFHDLRWGELRRASGK